MQIIIDGYEIGQTEEVFRDGRMEVCKVDGMEAEISYVGRIGDGIPTLRHIENGWCRMCNNVPCS